MNSLNNLKACIQTLHLFPSVLFIAATHPINTPFTCHCPLPRPGHRQSRRDPENGLTHTHPHATRRQEVATYLTDFMDLSNLLAGLLPGDSFLLRRKASRFFMSLALSERKDRWGREKKKICGYRRRWKEKNERKDEGGKKETREESVLSPSPKVHN